MKDQRDLVLVFSDEFNDPGRSFGDGSDTRWTAEDRPAVVNAALHYYNSSKAITTDDGAMALQTTREDSNWVEYDSTGREFYFQRDYQSAMVTTWNKFCFTSGVIEISVQLPGKPSRGGLWPAFWVRILAIRRRIETLPVSPLLNSLCVLFFFVLTDAGQYGEAELSREYGRGLALELR